MVIIITIIIVIKLDSLSFFREEATYTTTVKGFLIFSYIN